MPTRLDPSSGEEGHIKYNIIIINYCCSPVQYYVQTVIQQLYNSIQALDRVDKTKAKPKEIEGKKSKGSGLL
jgi:hypothetical protein